MRRSRRRNIRRKKQMQLLRKFLLFACCAVFLVSTILLLSYALDYIRSKQESQALRAIYYETESPFLFPEETPPPATPAPETKAPARHTLPPPAPTAKPTPSPYLPALRYPTNYYGRISSRFEKLQRQNKDIIGWLTIPEFLDEAVVQRDNSYYLNRDYLGRHNVNGAIFLEETCDLSTRPYTLMLYGHNMKTGAMFGCLRNFENISFYKKNPFITFDTAYEKGEFVIFAVGTASLKSYDRNYLHFSMLNSDHPLWRKEALEAVQKISVYHSFIDVTVEDQLLVLVTCVEDDFERRIVVARRIRENESKESLQKAIQNTFIRR